MTTIAETVKGAALTLNPHSESPRLDAELLLGKVLGLSRASLIARDNEAVAVADERQLAELISKRARGVPVAYLTGSREFWSLPLTVTPDVLVPRPETEILVQHALELLPAGEDARSVLDLGTGSGAIALSLATERPHWTITGVDLSPQALKVAAQNARALNLPRIAWHQGSWFDAVPGERFHLIVANPPYIAASDPALLKLKAEPAMALTSGTTGLESLTAIIAQAPQHLHVHGWLVLEHGSTQAPDVSQLLAQHGFAAIRTFPDLSGKPRITLGVHTQH
ncbi:MAG: peptide chain release factor N(5)-glutamine methyltransferase [Pseudomonadota bacterium]|nr:peptide chain release factor N(5)-glutamine methyltransferase [Pseudomonadota bacterium]